MSIDTNHALYDILRRRGVSPQPETREDEPGITSNPFDQHQHVREDEQNNIKSEDTQTPTEEVEYFEPPKEYDELLGYVESKWHTYRTVEPSRAQSEKVTRSELLNLAMKSNFRGRHKELLGAVIDIRDRDIIANRSFEGLGLESVKVEVEELSNASREYIHSKGVTDMSAKIVEYDNLRIVPEVFKIDKNTKTIEIGYNKVFNFKTYCESKDLPDMSVGQPRLVIRCHFNERFTEVWKVEMRTNKVDRLDFEGALSTPLKTYEVNIPLSGLKDFIESKRGITTTDIIAVSDKDIKDILISKSIGGRI